MFVLAVAKTYVCVEGPDNAGSLQFRNVCYNSESTSVRWRPKHLGTVKTCVYIVEMSKVTLKMDCRVGTEGRF